MDYRKTIVFAGKCPGVIETARSVFVNNNFKIESLSDTEIIAEGPGMYGTKQNPLVGATRVHIIVKPGRIDLLAELGGVRRLRNFVFFFPPALALVLSITFLFLPMAPSAALIPWLAVSPWLFLSPFVARLIKNRAISALDTLLHNMKTGSGRVFQDGDAPR